MQRRDFTSYTTITLRIVKKHFLRGCGGNAQKFGLLALWSLIK